MPYVIDGHNLIHVMPGIELDEEHDEVRLVQKLRGFFGRIGKKAEIVFDHGLPGGHSRDLSNSQVKVTFAPAHRLSADAVIMKRIRASRDAAQLVVVSSDREVRDAARAGRARVMTSQEFVAFMEETLADAIEQDRSEDVQLSASEVDAWLHMFGADED